MAKKSPEELEAQAEAEAEAEEKSEWEQQRIDGYLRLRCDFCRCSVESWREYLYDDQKEEYCPKKYPSANRVRKIAKIGFFENILAYGSKEKKAELDAKKAAVKKRLQEKIDKANAAEKERCDAHNHDVLERIDRKLKQLSSHMGPIVKQYFTFVLNSDSFSLNNNETNYYLDFSLLYDRKREQLIVDYILPTKHQISQVYQYKVDKNNEIIERKMNNSIYLEMYERVLFDISIRTVGILFDSDSYSLLKSIIFNGYCFYAEYQKSPTLLFSFEMPKSHYSNSRINRRDYVSKSEIAKLKTARYIGDIRSDKPPADLLSDVPPCKHIDPIRSSMYMD